MSEWRKRKKDGRPFKIRPKKRRTVYSSEVPNPKDPPTGRIYVPPDDFPRRPPKKPKPKTHQEIKDERFNRVLSLPLGHARGFLIKSTPAIVQLDPTLATIYTAWKFGKYSYNFYRKVDHVYEQTGDLKQALVYVTEHEVEDKIVSKVKSLPIKNTSQLTAKALWEHHKKENNIENINSNLDKVAEKALATTFEEILGKVI